MKIAPNIGGFENLYWLVEINSREEFSLMMSGRDIPIDSNVYLYSGNMSRVLTLLDVYRPAPHFQLREGAVTDKTLYFNPPALKLFAVCSS